MHSSEWMLSDSSRNLFGQGEQADEPFAVSILVSASPAEQTRTPTQTLTPKNEITPTKTLTPTHGFTPGVTPGQEIQEDEVNGGDIAIGQTVLGSVDDENYADFWYFTGTAGRKVSIVMSALLESDDLDPYIGLFYDDGQEWDMLEKNDDFWSGADGVESSNDAMIVAFELPYNGDYAITATRSEAENGIGGGRYVLALTDQSDSGEGMLNLVQNPGTELHIRDGIVIAVIDSGVNPDPALGKRLLTGVNVCDGSEDTSDAVGHGTTMAKLIHSIAPNALIYPIKNDCGGLADALSKSEAAGADIVNHSGYHGSNIATSDDASCQGSTIQARITTLFENNDAFIFSSSGNDSTKDGVRYPAGCQWVIGVGASAAISNQSQFVDISAESISTSEATARVTGITARIMEKFPFYSNSGIINALMCNTQDAGSTGWDNKFGIGLVDLDASLANGSKLGGSSGLAGSCIPWGWEKNNFGRNTWSVP